MNYTKALLDPYWNMPLLPVILDINLIKRIENIQHRFTKRLPGLLISYVDRLKFCNIELLELQNSNTVL